MTSSARAITPQLPPALQRAWRNSRWSEAARLLLLGLPALASFEWLALRLAGSITAIALATVLVVGGLGFMIRRLQSFDISWLARRLNALDKRFEDSIELVFNSNPSTSTLQQLQKQRLHDRLQRPPWPALHTPASRKQIASAWSLALVLLLSALAMPMLPRTIHRIELLKKSSNSGLEAALKIHPPAYTGLPAQTLTSLSTRVPVGSQIEWRLHFDDATNSVALVFVDGGRVVMQADGAYWDGQRVITVSSLYRIERNGTIEQEPLYRLDAIADQPPQITVTTPDKTLNLLSDGQKTWSLAFEARDDYGLGTAELSISLAQGSGDNVKTSEHTQILQGSGGTRQRSYRQTLDLTTLGFARGDDLIVRLSVSDNRTPEPNRSQSASFILRWPAEQDRETAGLDAVVQNILPAYFRSERQLIIDTEALQAQRGSLDSAHFTKTADGLGVDQKVLRLRYGQFLGEEFESNAEQAPVGVAETASKNAAKADPTAHDALKDIPPEPGAGAAAGAHASPSFGAEGNVVADNGHMHDQPEAATLLDPTTRRLLKSALDEMWQAELQLRQAQPEQALPYEYKALDFIKQVQQSERIYLARAGVELPQVDIARRLTGERKGLDDRSLKLAAADSGNSPITAAWTALQNRNTPDWDALEAWLRTHPTELADQRNQTNQQPVSSDVLGTIAAIEKLRAAPDCRSCATDLQARLWALLPAPPTAVLPRAAPDEAGTAYHDALSANTAKTAP